MIGTLVNVGAVLCGTGLGVLFGDRLPGRVREAIMHALGLVVLLVGIDAGLAAFKPPLTTLTRASVVIIMGSVLVGGIIGEALRIEDRLDSLGDALKRRFAEREAHFTEGFVAASLVFCVGPLAILGSIQDGLRGDTELLFIKSLLDGFASLGFASALGIGVGFSVIPLLLYQGSITLAASGVAGAFNETMIAAITAAGGVLIIGIAMRLLDLRQIRVGNLLPALVLAPFAVKLLEISR